MLQGGEDPGFRDEDLANTVRIIKEWFPDVAVTLSVGKKAEMYTKCSERQERTDTYYDMKLICVPIMKVSTRTPCLGNGGSNVWKI